MTDSALQLAKREWHSLRASPATWIALAASGVILGFIGPFGTDDLMRLIPRVTYWSAISVCAYLTGALLGIVIVTALIRRVPLFVAAALAGLTSGLVIMAEITLINWLVFGTAPTDLGYLGALAVDVLVISVIITVAAVVISRKVAVAVAVAPPRILDRLPFDKRGALLALSVQDHYVEVLTDKGRDLALMRLSDAIAETGGSAGLQTHRSQWVALDAITSAWRDGARAILTLKGGQESPVSRANLVKAKEAGLLPG